MALFEIFYEGIAEPLVVDDLTSASAIGFRRVNAFGNAEDSWHGLTGATKARLIVGKGESLMPPMMSDADSATLTRGRPS